MSPSRRQAIYKYIKQDCCKDCGTKDNLHFDHRDPSTKRFTISKGDGFSLDKVKKEAKKCDLRCGRCHRARHIAINPHAASVLKLWTLLSTDESEVATGLELFNLQLTDEEINDIRSAGAALTYMDYQKLYGSVV